MKKRLATIAAAAIVAFSLSACVPFPTSADVDPAPQEQSQSAAPEASAPSSASTAAPPAAQSTDDAVQAVADVVRLRYEYVRDGDYAAACDLYSDRFAQNLAALAETDGSSCVEAHKAGVLRSDTYEKEAAEQDRLPMTPFFYIPSEIDVDTSLISIEDNGTTAYLAPLAVVSLDPKEFSDGVGQVPGWIEGQDYLKLIDGKWLFIDMTEQ